MDLMPQLLCRAFNNINKHFGPDKVTMTAVCEDSMSFEIADVGIFYMTEKWKNRKETKVWMEEETPMGLSNTDLSRMVQAIADGTSPAP